MLLFNSQSGDGNTKIAVNPDKVETIEPCPEGACIRLADRNLLVTDDFNAVLMKFVLRKEFEVTGRGGER